MPIIYTQVFLFKIRCLLGIILTLKIFPEGLLRARCQSVPIKVKITHLNMVHIHKASENVAAKGVTLPMDKVKLCCGAKDFKDRVDSHLDKIQGAVKSGGTLRPAGR